MTTGVIDTCIDTSPPMHSRKTVTEVFISGAGDEAGEGAFSRPGSRECRLRTVGYAWISTGIMTLLTNLDSRSSRDLGEHSESLAFHGVLPVRHCDGPSQCVRSRKACVASQEQNRALMSLGEDSHRPFL